MAADQNDRSASKKLFAGPRIRRLRREAGMSQAEMATALGFSASYLNLVERNQRPVSAQLLLRLADVFDVELNAFAGTDEARAFADLSEILADPLFKGLAISRADMQDLVDTVPSAVDAFARLYGALGEARAQTSAITTRLQASDAQRDDPSFPVAEVRDYIQAQRNYWPELDERAEALSVEMGLRGDDPFLLMSARLEDQHGVRVRVMPAEVMGARLRHFDRHRRQIQLSELLDARGRQFQLAQQLAQLEFAPLVTPLITNHDFKSDEAQRLARITLFNYVAGAVLMPYDRFLADAKALHYDIDHLGRRYGTSFEQVCHRLTTLQRPGNKGVPFFFLRVDKAGNVSKRFSAGRFHFSKFGGTCPLWNVHDSFANPGRIITQIIQMPDDTTYFSVARTVDRQGETYGAVDNRLAVALGCDIAFAGELIYARGRDLGAPDPVPVGPTCRLCERPACAARVTPPLSKTLMVDERSRGVASVDFAQE